MPAVWNIINNALAMLKEHRPELRTFSVGLMEFLVDWGTRGPTIYEVHAPEILTCLCSVLEEVSGEQEGKRLWL